MYSTNKLVEPILNTKQASQKHCSNFDGLYGDFNLIKVNFAPHLNLAIYE
jgi:hypothetical protein